MSVGGGRRREATCVYWYMCRLCVHNYVFMGTFECTCVDISARMCVSVCVWGGGGGGGGPLCLHECMCVNNCVSILCLCFSCVHACLCVLSHMRARL